MRLTNTPPKRVNHTLSRLSLLPQMNVERRLFVFRFGDPQARMNWVHVDNLVLAHTLAAESLTQQRSYVSVSRDKRQQSV